MMRKVRFIKKGEFDEDIEDFELYLKRRNDGLTLVCKKGSLHTVIALFDDGYPPCMRILKWMASPIGLNVAIEGK